MLEEYSQTENDLNYDEFSDDELFSKHVIGDEYELNSLNNMVADYFTSFKVV